jgi:hypothetical protein
MARRKPIRIKVGNATVNIYCGKCRGYDLFTVVSYRPDGEKRKRFRQSFASLAQARLEATRVATAIANAEGDVLKLKSSDRATYLHAVNALRSLKIPLHVAVEEYVQARQHAGGASLIDAAKEYGQRHAGTPIKKTVAEVVKEFLDAKQQDGMSARYLRSLRSHLNRFADYFQMPIAAVTAPQIADWLRGTKRGPRTRKNLRNSLVTVFRFAKARGYLSRSWQSCWKPASKKRGFILRWQRLLACEGVSSFAWTGKISYGSAPRLRSRHTKQKPHRVGNRRFCPT